MQDSVDAGQGRPLWLVSERDVESWVATLPAAQRAWLATMRFRGERHQLAVLPAADGSALGAALGLGALSSLDELDLWQLAGAPDRLPAGAWRIASDLSPPAATAAALGWACGTYRFERYKTSIRAPAAAATLLPPTGADLAYVEHASAALRLARDLINAPAEDMDPRRLAEEALALAARHGAEASVVQGEELRTQFPAVHAVGRAATVAPRLIDLHWGQAAHPRVTLVGKGVCFDSGGLDIKAAAGMLMMKKDMGGAACVLALASMIMAAKLPVRLRVLIPAVENAIAGNAYRPGDVIRTRRGLTVEVGNTDAEGRLVLCDALAAASDERPDLLIDLATLTGAARVALGPELPAVFGTRGETVQALAQAGRALADPVWPMPLWSGYDEELASKVADLNNVSASPFAGAIIGALFLRRFIDEGADWLHLDLYAWNARDRPGRPVGGEAQAVRALYAMLRERYA